MGSIKIGWVADHAVATDKIIVNISRFYETILESDCLYFIYTNSQRLFLASINARFSCLFLLWRILHMSYFYEISSISLFSCISSMSQEFSKYFTTSVSEKRSTSLKCLGLLEYQKVKTQVVQLERREQ